MFAIEENSYFPRGTDKYRLLRFFWFHPVLRSYREIDEVRWLILRNRAIKNDGRSQKPNRLYQRAAECIDTLMQFKSVIALYWRLYWHDPSLESLVRRESNLKNVHTPV